MSKKRKTTSSADVYPQILTAESGTAGNVDDYQIGTITLPVNRVGTSKGKAQVVEILKVDWYLGVEDLADTSSGKFGFLSTIKFRSNGDTSTYATFAVDLEDPTVFAAALTQVVTSTSGAFTREMPITVDCSDKNGNGILIAVDKLFITFGDVGGTTAASGKCKIYYRLVDAPLSEFIGIVQSQVSRQIQN